MNPLQEYPFNTFIKAVCTTDPKDPNFDKPLAEVDLKRMKKPEKSCAESGIKNQKVIIKILYLN